MRKAPLILVIIASASLIFIYMTRTETGGIHVFIGGGRPVSEQIPEARFDFFQSQASDLIFNSLYMEDAALKDVPDIAERIVYSSDRKTWELTIRDDLTFHDGRGMTADDVVASIWETVKQGAVENGSLGRIMKSAWATGNYTVRFEFEQPVYNIIPYLSHRLIYPSDVIRQGDDWRKSVLENPIGSGPYRFDRWLENGFVLKANKDYAEGRPAIDSITYIWDDNERDLVTRLLKGEVDILTPVSPEIAGRIQDDPRFYLSSIPTTFYHAVFFNMRAPFFADRRMRMAVNLAINRDALIRTELAGGGVAASGPFPPGFWFADAEVKPYVYDPAQAAGLLKDAGWVDTDNDGVLERGGKRCRFRLIYSPEYGLSKTSRIADRIAQDMYEAGIEVETTPLDDDEIFKRRIPSGDYDAVLMVFNMAVNPGTASSQWQTRPSGGGWDNISNYSSREIDQLFAEGGRTDDIIERKGIYRRIHRILHEDAPAAFLFHPVQYSASSRRFFGAENFRGLPHEWRQIKDWKLKNAE